MKRFIVILLVVSVLFSANTFCLASALDDVLNVNLDNYRNNLNLSTGAGDGTDGLQQLDGGFSVDFSGILRTIYDVLTIIPKRLLEWAISAVMYILPSMESIVFNESDLWGNVFRITFFDSEGSSSLAYGFRGFVSAIYQGFRYIALIFFLIVIAILAIKIMLSSIGAQKAQYKDMLKHWVIGILLLVAFHWVMIFAISMNDYFVSILAAVKNNILVVADGGDTSLISEKLDEFQTQRIWGNASRLISTFCDAAILNITPPVGTPIGILLVFIAFCVFLYINFQVVAVYLKRLLVIAVLIMIFPIVTVFYVLDKTGIRKGDIFGTWLKEFFANVFIQTIHALILLIIIGLLETDIAQILISLPFVGLIFYLIILNMLFTVENLIEKIFSMSGTATLGKPIDMGRTIGGMIGSSAIASSALRRKGVPGAGFLSSNISQMTKAVGPGNKAKAFLGLGGARADALSAKWGSGRAGAFGAGMGRLVGGVGDGFMNAKDTLWNTTSTKDKLAIGKTMTFAAGGYIGGQIFDAATANIGKGGLNGNELKNAANGDGKSDKAREKNIKVVLSKFNDMQVDNTMKKLGMNSMDDLYDSNGKIDQRKANLLMAALTRPDLSVDSLMAEDKATNGANITKLLNEQGNFLRAKDDAQYYGQITEGLNLADDAVANVMKNGVKGKMVKEALAGDTEQSRVFFSKFNKMQIDNTLGKLDLDRASVLDDAGNVVDQGNANMLMASLLRPDVDPKMIKTEHIATGGRSTTQLIQAQGELLAAREEAKDRGQTLDEIKLADTVKAKNAATITIGSKSMAIDGVTIDGDLSTDIKAGGVSAVVRGANVKLNMADPSVTVGDVGDLRELAKNNMSFGSSEVLSRVAVEYANGVSISGASVDSVAKARIISEITQDVGEQEVLMKALLSGVDSLGDDLDKYNELKVTKLGGDHISKVINKSIRQDSAVASLIYAQSEGYIKEDAVPASVVYDVELDYRTIDMARKIHLNPVTNTNTAEIDEATLDMYQNMTGMNNPPQPTYNPYQVETGMNNPVTPSVDSYSTYYNQNMQSTSSPESYQIETGMNNPVTPSYDPYQQEMGMNNQPISTGSSNDSYSNYYNVNDQTNEGDTINTNNNGNNRRRTNTNNNGNNRRRTNTNNNGN